MSSRRRQAASGSTSTAAAHVPPPTTAVTPRLNPMVAAFRREVISMLNTPPPLPRHLAHLAKEKVEVVAAFERISLHGEQQQSAQLCRVGGEDGEMWVTRTEGERYYFPNAGRVNKRAREVQNEGDDYVTADGEGSRDMDVEGEEQETPTARRARARAHRRNPRGNVEQDDPSSEGWFPQHDENETPAHASTSRTRNTAAPNAPKKARRAPRSSQRDLDADADQYEFDEGEETEREGAGRRAGPSKKSKKGKSKASTSATNAEASGSGAGARRSARRAARDSPATAGQQEDVFVAKREQTVDDLDSLCGGFGGFELGSSIAGSVAPELSSASFDFASPEDIKPIIAGPSTSA
ncbi:hypothetical protein BCR35DRAFT_326789 [Leucosporidium creatinivorum]|uniref:Uncharacterized protein n=1 Tax=Leucosporidium creatinivorum TaxID=106004 RepID=A0A1Y2DKY9_9BASI|nr:hypothetical protein BCR35DRAFT_326789 [Leucosporidium creatinivorum]